MSFLATPLEAVYEAPGLPVFDLPDELARDYGGPFGIGESRLFANFVSSVDGITAIPSVRRSNTLVSGGSQSDRFVMGLLRASADVVVIGSATLAAAPRSLWSPEQVFPPAADAFAELRRRIGRPPVLELAVLTANGTSRPRTSRVRGRGGRVHDRPGRGPAPRGASDRGDGRLARPGPRA